MRAMDEVGVEDVRGKLHVALAAALLVAAAARAQVSAERLRAASAEPQNWLTYSGGYSSWRYSTLDQINPGNASRL